MAFETIDFFTSISAHEAVIGDRARQELIARGYTANWVAFEIGLATNWRSHYLIPRITQDHIDIYVFEPVNELVNFCVPYCTYYMPYQGSGSELGFLRELIEDAPYHNKGIPVKCPYDKCKIEFKLLADLEFFYCPTCKQGITMSPPQPKNSA